MKASGLIDFLVEQDMFGQSISVFYKARDVFKTKMGALASICTYMLMLFNLTTLLQAYAQGTKQQTSFETSVLDLFTAGAFPLIDYGLELSVLLKQRLPSRFGRVRLIEVTGGLVWQEGR